MNKTLLLSKKHAIELDKNDPLSYLKKTFHTPKTESGNPYIYLCGHSLGLQPNSVYNIINEELEAWKRYGVEGHHYGKRPWIPYHQLLTQYSTELVGALEKEVVVMNSLTVNLHLLMASFYQPKGRKKKILIENNAFPSDYYAVQSQLKFHNNHPIDDLIILQSNDDLIITTDIIEDYFEQYGDEISMVLIGGVNYYSGQVFDIKTITKKAHQYGCLVGFDLAHSTGNVLLSLHNWGVDFATWCGYKYLNGGPGAPSGVFIHERHLGKTNIPRFEGWWGHNSSTRFQMPKEFNPIDTAEAWQLSNPPILALAPLIASLKIFHEADIKTLRDKSIKLISYLRSLINLKLGQKIKIITPVNGGCQLSLRLTNPKDNFIMLLKSNEILADWREPDIIRIAPVPLYNSFLDCYKFVNRLEKIINE